MKTLFVFPGHEQLGLSICNQAGLQLGEMTVRHFPDGESYVRIHTNIEGHEVYLLCSLDRPDTKAMALLFFAETAREMGAESIRLIAPYLGYMRQDKQFQPGEAVTSPIFAHFLSRYFDALITIDPHLHRTHALGEIYTIPTKVLHANLLVADWIRDNISRPLLIGPDEESQQWVEIIAERANAEYIVLKKERFGDREVHVSFPDLAAYHDLMPVLVDDIISTAQTMIQTIKQIKGQHPLSITCVGIHAVFAEQSFQALKAVGVERIVTSNTIPHISNQIDVSMILAESL